MARHNDSLGDFRERFDEQLTCGICLYQYTQPTRLPCQHSFCLKCIERIAVEIYDGNCYSIMCPVCRQYIPLPQGGARGFPPAYDLVRFLDLQKELAQRKSTHFYCELHNDRLTLYCETCHKVICRDCVFSQEHANHQHTCRLIVDCYHHHKQVMEAEMMKCRADVASLQQARREVHTRVEMVDAQRRRLEGKLNAHTQKIIDQALKYQEILLKEINAVTEREKQQLTDQNREIERKEKEIQDGLQFNKLILKEFTPEEVLKEKDEALKRMNHHIEARLLRPQVTPDIELNLFNVDMKNGIGELRYNGMDNGPPLAPLNVPTESQGGGQGDGRNHRPPVDQFAVIPIPNVNPAGGSPGYLPRQQQLQRPIPTEPLPPLPELKQRNRSIQTIPGLIHPSDVTICNNGEIMVTEYDYNRITVLDMVGNKIRDFRITGGPGDEEVYRPNGLASLNDGHILVTDIYRLWKITPTGACVKSIGGEKSGLLNRPKGIAVHPTTGDIFVADCTNNRIQVFTDQLEFKQTIKLLDDQYLKKPLYVAIDSKGHLYVVEKDRHCITKLTTTGKYIDRFGSEGQAPDGHLKHPSSVTLSGDNVLYVTERGNHRVSVFDVHGRFLQVFGRVELDQPFGIAIDKNTDNVYVTDYSKERLVVF